MKRKLFVIISLLLVFSALAAACTRSASGGVTDSVADGNELPNPVSTQSQLMKDIIAGTQTAMAVPVEETEEAAEGEAADGGDEADTEATPEPADEEPEEEIVLPTSTAGPPPVVELIYNNVKCGPGLYLCIKDYVKDQTVTVQATYPWLLDDMELTFKAGLEGTYDYSQYIVVGTAEYTGNADKGFGFETTLNLPDSLRGAGTIVVLLETNDVNYYGLDYYDNN